MSITVYCYGESARTHATARSVLCDAEGNLHLFGVEVAVNEDRKVSIEAEAAHVAIYAHGHWNHAEVGE